MTMQAWSTSDYPPAARFDAWQSALNRTHLDWQLQPPADAQYVARLRSREVGDVRIIECRCAPCHGRRGQHEIARAEAGYYGVLFKLGGREVLRRGAQQLMLDDGELVLWDSEQAMEFEVVEPLHKLTLLVPKPRLDALLGGAERYVGQRVPVASGVAGIAAEALRRCLVDLNSNEQHTLDAMLDPLLAMLSATLIVGRDPSQSPSSNESGFQNACRYIDRHLSDPALSPTQIAQAQGISLRSLHLLFAAQTTSVSRWILLRRLQRCYDELSKSKRRETVTHIAFRWGFSDLPHFSRSFKTRYGVTPRELRGAAASVSCISQVRGSQAMSAI